MNFVDLVIVICFVLFLGAQKEQSKLLSKESCDGVKGILTVVVILCHTAPSVAPGSFISYFPNWGTLAVGIFFLISGYGIMYSYRKTEGAYLHGFLVKRLSKIVVPYAVMNIIFFVYFSFKFKEIYRLSMSEILFKGGYLVPYSWYVIAIIYFYIIFYVAGRMCKKTGFIIGFTFLGTCIYAVWCKSHNFGDYWFISSFNFCLGLILATKIGDRVKTFITGQFLTCSVMLIGTYALLGKAYPILSRIFPTEFMALHPFFIQFAQSALFAVFILTIGTRFSYENQYIKKMSKYSFATYMCQYIPINVLRGSYVHIRHDAIYVILVLIISFTLGWLITKGCDRILLHLNKKMCS